MRHITSSTINLRSADYYPFGMVMTTRTDMTAFAKYKYGYNGKENDNEIKGNGNQEDYSLRIYDPRICKFLSVDPLTHSYPELTPYQFASNTPIQAADLDGLEADYYLSRLWREAGITTATDQQIKYNIDQLAKKAEPYAKFGSGLINTTFGTVGTISSITYIAGSGGAGAPLGGASALMLSLGEVAVGFGQMSDAISGGDGFVHNASTLPGVISAGVNSPYTGLIDAVSGLGAGGLMSGGIKAFLKDGVGAKSAYSDFTRDKSILNALNLIDAALDAGSFGLEALKLTNNFDSKNNLQSQNLSFTLNYTIKKGDTLAAIAKQLNTSVQNLANQNNISDVNSIKDGQKLTFSHSINSQP